MKGSFPFAAAVLALLIIFPLSTSRANDLLYVQSLSADLMDRPAFDAAAVGALKRGDLLEVIGREGDWHHVRTESRDGWIHRLTVARHPPLERMTVISEEGADLERKSRRRVSSFRSAAASRGLSEEDRRSLSVQNPADFASLEWLEGLARGISATEVDAFDEP